jgi:hypothetical protein
MSVADCRIVELPKIKDQRGNLTFVEENRHVPFPIRRVYYLYDVPGGEVRGGHAHRLLQQLIIAVSGSFEVVLDDGVDRVTRRLLRADEGLLVRPWTWRELQGFTSGAVCLVLASEPYDEADYIRDYLAFKAEAGRRTP